MSFLRKIYLSLCQRIYSVGMVEHEKRQLLALRKRAIIKERTIFYPGSEISNLPGDPTSISIGVNCHIYGNLTIIKTGAKIEFGDNCSFGDHSRILCTHRVTIGNRVMISHNVNILDSSSHPSDAKVRHQDFMNAYTGGQQEFDLKSQEVIIEDDVSVGLNVTILKGVTIGKEAIIAPGSVVLTNVPPKVIAMGNPAKVVWKLES